MQKRLGVWLSAVCCLLCAVTPAAAGDDSEAQVWRQEVQQLKSRLDVLETKLAEREAVQAGAAPGNAIVQLPSGLHGVEMSGFVDTTYTYNFDEPRNGLNTLRVFDTRSNSFMLNNAELVVQKPVSAESPVGFRTDLDFGTDAEVLGTLTPTPGLGIGTDELDVQQAFVEYLAPIGNGLDVKVGKFVTLHGAEVIESRDNWNISRSLLFGFAIPFTHTGIRASYPWTEGFSTVVGVNNGWDVVDDNNKAKTMEFGFSAVPLEGTSLGATYMVGAEQNFNNGNQRHLFDLVAGWQPIEPLQLKLNYDYGLEDDGTAFANNAVWQGLAGYARYAITDRWAVALRSEFFHDQDGVRTGFNTTGLNGIVGSNGLKMYETTLTSEYQVNKHLTARLEYRHDNAPERIFRSDSIGQRSYQDTIGMEFIAPF